MRRRPVHISLRGAAGIKVGGGEGGRGKQGMAVEGSGGQGLGGWVG